MTRIRVHNPRSMDVKYFRNYELFWDRLTDRLRRSFEVDENRPLNATSLGMSAPLKAALHGPLSLRECEYAIENLDNDEFVIMSLCDVSSHGMFNEHANPKLYRVLVAQYWPRMITDDAKDDAHKYHPWIYFPMDARDLDVWYYRRKWILPDNLINKLYFRGGVYDRPILAHFDLAVLEGPQALGTPDEYFDDVIRYRVGLSIGGKGEVCYRDIEYMAMGIPFIRFTYTTPLDPPLIPNYHYIAVPRPVDLYRDREGGAEHAQMIIRRYREVYEAGVFLDFVAANARQYYLDYLAPYAVVEHTLKLLNIEEAWL